MKTKLNLAFALMLALGFTMNGQVLVKEMFNTGAQPTSYSTYRAYGMQDVSWWVAQTSVGSAATPPTSAGAYVRAVTQDASAIPGWWDPHSPLTMPNAGWITYPNTCSPTLPARHDCLPGWGVDQWYKISFYICCDPSDFCISLDMWADNRIQEVYVNTTSNSGSGYWSDGAPYTGPIGDYDGYRLGNVVSQRFCNNFVQGLNYLIIHILSNSPNSHEDRAGLLVHATDVSDCNGSIIYSLPTDDQDSPGKRVASVSGKKTLSLKDGIVLNQNVPNPFAESSVITYNIPNDFTKAQVLFRDINGVLVKSVEITQKGKGSLKVFGDDLSHGMYSYQLVVDGTVIEVKKMIKE